MNTLAIVCALAPILAGADAPSTFDPAALAPSVRPPPLARRTPSGLVYFKVRPGGGLENPNLGSIFIAHFTGYNQAGQVLETTRDGQVAELTLDRVTQGFKEGLMMVHAGDVFRFWIPPALAYGNYPGAPKGVLIYDLEVFDIRNTPPSRPPEQATFVPGGIVFQVLRTGTGTEHPSLRSNVEVRYQGFKEDGSAIDATGRPYDTRTFRLQETIQGWQDVLRMMVTGEKRRVWIPGELAYGSQKGKPQGPLMFDIDLVAFED
jgi:FKBP-type peptidyl-prolyl cis-trans isomerase